MYDYVGSKMEWIGAGLPFDGTLAARATIGKLADPDVPTCQPDELAGAIRGHLGAWPICVVTNDRRIVLGLVLAESLADIADDRPVIDAMREGPSTYRPHVTAAELAPKLEKKPARWVIVTNLDGKLVGVADPARIRTAANDDPDQKSP